MGSKKHKEEKYSHMINFIQTMEKTKIKEEILADQSRSQPLLNNGLIEYYIIEVPYSDW